MRVLCLHLGSLLVRTFLVEGKIEVKLQCLLHKLFKYLPLWSAQFLQIICQSDRQTIENCAPCTAVTEIIFFMFLKKTFQSLLSKFCSKRKKIQMLNTKHRVTDLVAISLKKFNYQFFQFLRQLYLLLLMFVLSLFYVAVRRPVAEMIWVTFWSGAHGTSAPPVFVALASFASGN